MLPQSGQISLDDVRVELELTNKIGLGQEEVRELAEVTSGEIGMDDLYSKESFPNPKLCDYYFETREDFNVRINQIIAENNGNLSQKTFGFSDSVTNLSSAFILCNFAPKMIIAKNVTSFMHCFYYCDSLTTIPEGLFANCPNVTDFSGCFENCTSLTTVPAGLFANCPKVTNFSDCFNDCDSLTAIPEGLFDKCTNVTEFNNCFYKCTSLTTIPEMLFANCLKVTDFSCCFYDCISLTTSLPDIWNKDKFPNVIFYFKYAYNCIKASNYNEIPENYK